MELYIYLNIDIFMYGYPVCSAGYRNHTTVIPAIR